MKNFNNNIILFHNSCSPCINSLLKGINVKGYNFVECLCINIKLEENLPCFYYKGFYKKIDNFVKEIIKKEKSDKGTFSTTIEIYDNEKIKAWLAEIDGPLLEIDYLYNNLEEEKFNYLYFLLKSNNLNIYINLIKNKNYNNTLKINNILLEEDKWFIKKRDYYLIDNQKIYYDNNYVDIDLIKKYLLLNN